MKQSVMAMALALAGPAFTGPAFTGRAFAQDTSMPGMNMPAQPKPKTPPSHQQPPSKKPATPAQNRNNSMPKMDMTPATPAQTQDKTMPRMDLSQPAAPSGAPPKSKGMQGMQGMHTDSPMAQPASPSGGDGSITHDTMNLQEPEDPAHKTGSSQPAPDLLKDVAARPALSLEDFIQLADKTNPTLAQAKALVARSAAQARQAGLYPNPSVGYQGEQIRGGAYGGGEHGAYLQQSVVLGGKLGLRRNIFNQQQQSDRIGVEEQVLRIHGDVTQAFYAALTSQAMAVVRQRLVGVAHDAVATVHQLANVGQADSPDILQAEVEAEQATVDFETAQRDFLQSFHVLAALSGSQSLPVAPLSGSLDNPPELNAEQQVETIVSASPAVRRMQTQVAVDEARLRAAKREVVPDLQLKAGEQYNFEHLIDRPVRPVGPQSFASAGITLPLWNRNQGNIGVAQAEVERARQEVTRVQLTLRKTAEPLAQSYLSSRFTVERYRNELIPRAQRAYQLYLKKYQAMAMAYPQVLVSQRTLFQLQIGYLTALHSVWKNAVSLQNYTLSGGLDAPLSTGSASSTINLPNASAASPE